MLTPIISPTSRRLACPELDAAIVPTCTTWPREDLTAARWRTPASSRCRSASHVRRSAVPAVV